MYIHLCPHRDIHGFPFGESKKTLEIHYAQNFVRPLFPFEGKLAFIIWFLFHLFNITSIKLGHFISICRNLFHITTKCKEYIFDILKCWLTKLYFFHLVIILVPFLFHQCMNCIIWYSIDFFIHTYLSLVNNMIFQPYTLFPFHVLL